MVDDKLRILPAMQKIWGDRLTTVWPRQGHYAIDPQAIATYPRPTLRSSGSPIRSDAAHLRCSVPPNVMVPLKDNHESNVPRARS
jgi:hypothetical protein